MSQHSPIFLQHIEMNSMDSYNILHLRTERTPKECDPNTWIETLADGRMINVRRKSRFDHNFKKTIFFDAIGIQFHFSIFCKQFFMHLFFPLIFLTENRRGQGLHCRWPSVWWNIVSPILVYVMIGSYFALTFSDQNYLGQSIFIPLMLYLVHRCVLSLKYACLSPTEYERFMKCQDPELLASYNSQIHLMSGWIGLDMAVLMFEIGAASARIGVKINEIFLYICNANTSSISQESTFRFWNAFLRGHDTIDWEAKPAPEIRHLPTGRVGISVYDIVQALVLRAVKNDSHPFYVKFLLFLIVISIIIISFIPLCTYWLEIDRKGAAILFQISSTIINFQFGYVFFALLYLAIIDVKRRKRMSENLHCMIRSTDLAMESTLSILPVNSVVTERCRDVAAARSDAVLSITDVHDFVYVTSEEATDLLKPDASSAANQQDEGDGGPCQSAESKDSDKFFDKIKKVKPPQNEFDLADEVDRESEVLGENIAKALDYAVTPRISFNYPENVIAWLYARLAVQHFGDRFRFRIDIYVGVSLALTLFLMLFAIISIFTATDRHDAFASTFFLQSLLAVTLLLLYLMFIFSLGSGVNDELEFHRKTLIARAVKVRARLQCARMGQVTQEELDNLEEVLKNLNIALTAIQINNELKPIQILGFNAQRALTVSVATAAISFYSTLLALYLNSTSLLKAATTTV